MNYCVHNIIAILSVRSHSSFIRAGRVFFGLIFCLVFGLKSEAQTATIVINTTSVCKGGTEPVITFTGSDGTPEYTFNYIIDNGTTQSSLTTGTSTGDILNLSVSTAVPGTYVYTLQLVTDVNNNFTNITGQSVTVIVNPLPAPSISASGPTTFRCPGGNVTLSTSAPPTGGSYSYQWVRVSDLGNDTTDIANSTNSSILVTGGYRYAVRVTDNNGCVAVSDTIKVQQNPPPPNLYGAHNTTSEAACISYDPDILNFDPPNTAVSGGVGPYTYQWQSSTDGGASWNNISGGTSNSYDPPDLLIPGSYSYRAIINDVCGEPSPTVAKTITIHAAPTVIVTAPTRCSNDPASTIAATPLPAGTYTYAWTVPAGVINPGNVASFASTIAGSYGVTITDGNDCSASGSATLTVNAAPSVIVTAPTRCSNDPASTITASPSPAGTYTYAWAVPVGVTNPGNVASFTSTIAGSYGVTITDGNSCSATGLATLTVNTAPTVIVTAPTRCSNDLASTITATPLPAGSYTYAWTVPVGVTNPGNVATFTSTIAGSYGVTITDGNSCSATGSATLTVNAGPTITLGTNPSVCRGVTTANLTYSTTTGTPNQYSIDYDATATAANFTDVTNVALPAGTIVLTVPAAVPAGIYNAILTVRNNTTGCLSSSYPVTITVNPRPAPTITGSASGCVGSTGNIYTTEAGMSGYTWTVSTGGTITAGVGTNSITVSWTTIGAKTITVNYTDANGCTATITTSYAVAVNTNPTATITGATSFCAGGSLVLSATTSTPGSGTISGYQWNLSGTPIAGATSPTYTVTAAGSYTVTVTNSNNCSITSAVRNVTVIALPTITLGTNPSICRGVITTTLPYSATTGTPNQYSIDYDLAANAAGFVDVTNLALPANQITLAVPGSAAAAVYNATLTVRNSTNLCVSNSYPITITVNARPVPTITGSPTACVGSTGNIYTTEAGTSGYTWTVSTGGTITAGAGTNSITVSWTTTGAKTITVNYTNANGCNATTATSYAVTVNTNPTATVTGATSFCAGGSTVLSAATSTPGSGTISGYQWNLSGTPIFGATPSTYTVTAAGSYTVTVTNSNNCFTASAVRNITVTALPTITLGANPSVCRGVTTANLPYSATTGTPNQYSIDYDPAANAANFTDVTNATLPANTIVLTVPAAAPAAIYNAILTVRNSTTGCVSGSYPITITVNARPVPTITGSASGCVGSTGNIYTTEAGMSGYTWAVSAGGTITAGAGTNSITVSWTTTGTKTITVNYINANGCNATTATSYTVTVNANPTVNTITGLTSVCVGSTITLANTTAGGIWSSSNPAIATINSSGLVAGASSGPVTISYAVTNGNGCTTTVTRTITVNAQPSITVPAPAALCSGGSVTLTATGANTYSWSPATGLSITTGSTVISTPEVTTTYTVTGTGANGCTNSTTVTVTVVQSPEGEMSSEPPVCYGNNSGVVTLSNNTGTILRWESSTNGGITWTTISGTSNNNTTSVPYSNLTQTTIYRAVLELNGCQSYSSIGIIPVNPLFVPTVTATPPIICLGQSAVLAASGYGQPPFPVEDFQNANPAGWSGNDANNNNEDPNSDWGETAQSGKVFNGIPYNSNAPPLSSKFMIVTGTTDGTDNTASLITPPFSLAGTINPIFNYWTALNFTVGTTGTVDISTDGGVTWTNLHTYTGPTNVGNPNNGWSQNSINLSAYIGQPNIMVRFNYTGTAGSNWAVDNVGIAATFQPVTYQWSPTTYLTPANGQGQTVTTTPTAAGTFPYCVVATSAVGCSSPPVCVDVVVKPLPTCSITGASTVCPGATTTYSAPAIAGYTYNWTISGGATISGSATGQTVTVVANNSCGTYTLTLVTTLNGCASAPCTQVVNVVDNTAPVAPVAPATQSFQCLANVPAPGTLTATDNCRGNITVTGVDVQVTNGCGYTITRTWTFTDACNNTTSVSQTINVLDNTAPVAPAAPATQSFQCIADVPAPGTLTATDNCSGNINATGVDVQVANGCGYTITRTWTFTDACNNTSSVSQTINVFDNTAPVITCPPAFTSCVVNSNNYTIPLLNASDNCSGALTITYQVAGATTRNGTGNNASGIFNVGISTITWTVTDACGNTSACTTSVTISPGPTPIIYHN